MIYVQMETDTGQFSISGSTDEERLHSAEQLVLKLSRCLLHNCNERRP